MMGYEPHAYLKIRQTFLSELEKCLHLLSKAQKEAITAHKKAALFIKDHINSHFIPWKVRDKVWLDNKNLKLHYQSKKLAPKREGAFKIEQVLSPSTYKLCIGSIAAQEIRMSLPALVAAIWIDSRSTSLPTWKHM